MISADARLTVADALGSKLSDAPYFGNCERFSMPWKLAMGDVDGEPVVNYFATRRRHVDAVFNSSLERDWPAHRPRRGLRALPMDDLDGGLKNRRRSPIAGLRLSQNPPQKLIPQICYSFLTIL